MIEGLIQKLRTCSSKERKAVAMELARTGTNETADELIRMVEGRRRYWLSWYNLDDQLIGVEALGETGRVEALEYLKHVYTPTIDEWETNYNPAHRQISYLATDRNESYTYTNARKELFKELNFYILENGDYDYSNNNLSLEQQRVEIFQTNNSHKIFRKSIQKLESTVQKHLITH